MLKEEVHVIFQGRVQGVGFRATAREIALELNLTGFVQNLDDGSVEVCAQGFRKDLDLLVQRLKEEFDTQSKISFQAMEMEYRHFDIRR